MALDREQIRRLAEQEEALGDLDAAARRWRDLLDDDPSRSEIWRDLASCERRRDDPAAAAEAMRHYLDDHPDDAQAWASLGDFLDDAGRTGDAESAWRRAIELDPDDVTFYYNQGVSAGRRKDLERVRASAAALLSRDPDSPLAAALESILHEAAGDIWRGWEAMRGAVEREPDPGCGRALAHRALRYARRHDLAEAASDLIDDLHARNLLDEDVLEVINRLERGSSTRARDFAVSVDVLPGPGQCPPELIGADGVPRVRGAHRLRVVAETAENARRYALAFERRCGAAEVEVLDVEDLGAIEAEDHLGVWWSQEALELYPPA